MICRLLHIIGPVQEGFCTQRIPFKHDLCILGLAEGGGCVLPVRNTHTVIGPARELPRGSVFVSRCYSTEP